MPYLGTAEGTVARRTVATGTQRRYVRQGPVRRPVDPGRTGRDQGSAGRRLRPVAEAHRPADSLRVADGKADWTVRRRQARQLETKPLKSLQIESITVGDEKVKIQLSNASNSPACTCSPRGTCRRSTRSASSARCATPSLTSSTTARRDRSISPAGTSATNTATSSTGAYAQKYPGQHARTASLLLNPWAVRETETGEQVAVAGGEFGAARLNERGRRPTEQAAAPAEAAAAGRRLRRPRFPGRCLGRLAEPGSRRRRRDRSQSRTPSERKQDIHVVAVDPLNTTYRTTTLPEPKPLFVDLRLKDGLDPQDHFTQQKQITIVDAKATIHAEGQSPRRVRSLRQPGPGVRPVRDAESKTRSCRSSRFVLNWPKLKPEEKRTNCTPSTPATS